MGMWWLDKDGGSRNFRVVQKGWQRIELIQGSRFYGSSGGKKYPASLVCSSLWFSRREAILIILMAVVSTIMPFCCKEFYDFFMSWLILSKGFVIDNSTYPITMQQQEGLCILFWNPLSNFQKLKCFCCYYDTR